MTLPAFWQDFLAVPEPPAPPYRDRFPARMPDGRHLLQPLRVLPGAPDAAVAGLIITQASLAVEDRIAAWLADAVRDHAPDVVAAMPTLGLVLGRNLAARLGHAGWVALGYSRKFWYEPALSAPVSSITSPDTGKTVWLDPRMVDRLRGRRVLFVDDVISNGSSALAGLAVLAAAGVRPVALAVAMTQGDRWRARWPADIPVRAVWATPRFSRLAGSDGFAPIPGSAATDCCPLLPPGAGAC
ncbi:MAG: phosphoribosyltransferase [Alphaproteobacteria bacterium]|nr:phosphoribosyltransferase [Alphaproteobacteria bacterium]